MLPVWGIFLVILTVILIQFTNKVGILEMRLPNGFRVRLRLAHKLLFFSQVI